MAIAFTRTASDYVWLPVRFDGEMAYLDWQDEWRVEDDRKGFL